MLVFCTKLPVMFLQYNVLLLWLRIVDENESVCVYFALRYVIWPSKKPAESRAVFALETV